MHDIGKEMSVDELPIPVRLVSLIQRGFWPQTEAEERRQNSRSLVPKERIQVFAPEQREIYLLRPPFYTVARRLAGDHRKFWSTFAALEGISPDLSLDIGSFGLGSDSPILLDYRDDRSNPAVIRLQWRKRLGLPNIWVRCSDNFDEFADMLGLDSTDRSHPGQ